MSESKRRARYTLEFKMAAIRLVKGGQVELLFKWIKQHLRIKVFFGTSKNVVKTQVWIAISTYC